VSNIETSDTWWVHVDPARGYSGTAISGVVIPSARLTALIQVAEAAQRHLDAQDRMSGDMTAMTKSILRSLLVAAGYAPEEKDATDG
jgi:hypothetical protein